MSFCFTHKGRIRVHTFELIGLAALAGAVLFQLYAVLGRRVGRGPEDVSPRLAPALGGSQAGADSDLPSEQSVIAAVRARDPSFDVGQFIAGARQAYEMIVKAFIAGDRETLKPLVSATVMASFETAIADRESAGVKEEVSFPQPPRADFEGVNLAGDVARASVRFLAELHSRIFAPDGEKTEERRTAEVWTFERNLKSRNPNWTLIHVDPAEA